MPQRKKNMVRLIQLKNVSFSAFFSKEEINRARELCVELEKGNVLKLPKLPQLLTEKEWLFFVEAQKEKRKNFVYSLQGNKTFSFVKNKKNMAKILQKYEKNVSFFLSKLLQSYATFLQKESVFYYHKEEKKESFDQQRLKDLLDVSGNSRQISNGDRFLRFCTNIHPNKEKQWNSSFLFHEMIKKFGTKDIFVLMTKKRKKLSNKIERKMKKFLSMIGFSISVPSSYDYLMKDFYDFFKGNKKFSKTSTKQEWHFSPFSSWIFFSDATYLSSMEGEDVIGVNYIVSRKKMLNPETAPVSILERLLGDILVEPKTHVFKD